MNVITKIAGAMRDIRNHPINRNRKNRAVIQYGFIQVAARFVPGEICVEFPNNTRLLIPPHMKGAAHYITPRLCEFEDMAFVMHYLRPEDLFIDVGSNLGAFTLLAAGVAGSRVVAFEPNPDTFATLVRNIRLNTLGERIKPVNAAVGRAAGHVQMSAGLGTENHVATIREHSGAITVKVTTLDDELAGGAADFLKVDVEGFESEVFAGAPQTLRNPRLQALIVERNDSGNRYGFDEQALHQQLRTLGFQPCRYEPFARRIIPSDQQAGGNIIYLRNLETAAARVKNAAPFQLDDLRV
jgi:FkbM family methyltransferase